MKYTIFDLEGDGLLDTATKIHCLSYQIYEGGLIVESGSMTSYSEMIVFVLKQEILVGHNIITFDIPYLERFLGIKIPDSIKLIDTLGLSWYLYPDRMKHGLAVWGEDLGFGKPEIEDWSSLPIEEYINRCESDVEITVRLFKKIFTYLQQIYGSFELLDRMVGYVSFKLDCLKEQQFSGIDLDTTLCERLKLDLEFLCEEKLSLLASAMPKDVAKVFKSKPKVMLKKNGDLSVHGQNWFTLLERLGLPEDTEVVYDEPNPGSSSQLKTWLLRMDWKPITFKVSKATGKKVPQLSLPFGGGICPSVKALYPMSPALIELEGLYVAKHRLGVVKGFLETVDKNGKIYSKAHGFTNTMRLTHSKPIVNLPGVYKSYGKEIRSCLTVYNENMIMCGSDLSGIEDNTKQHYIYNYDPDYVNEMRTPGFCPHLDIGLLGGSVTKEEADFYKFMDGKPVSCPNKYLTWNEADKKAEIKRIKKIRSGDKQVNFSATYGAGAAKIAETGKRELSWGKMMHKTYWTRNKAVKQTARDCKVKIVDGQKWLYNPISGFWMFLKAEKDRFSTLNQSSAVYVFDSWVRKIRQHFKLYSIPILLQYHDEILFVCHKDNKEEVEKILYLAMKETNQEIQLNVPIGISVDWGRSYAECH